MSLLDSMQLVSKSAVSPMMVTITGEAGTAKTSLAALFPNVLIIRIEDGTKSISNKDQVMQTPILDSSHQVIQWLSDIYNADSPIKYIAFDSVTKLNAIIEDEVVNNDPKKPKSINTAQGGFGAGLNAVAKIHRDIKSWCDALRVDKNIGTIFIAHSKIQNLDSPDLDSYSRYGLKMGNQSVGVYVDDVDMVCQLRLNTVVMSGDSEMARAKAKAIGGISIHAHAEPSGVNKNRYGIKKAIPFVKEVFPFQSIIDTGDYIENYNVNTETGEIKGENQNG